MTSINCFVGFFQAKCRFTKNKEELSSLPLSSTSDIFYLWPIHASTRGNVYLAYNYFSFSQLHTTAIKWIKITVSPPLIFRTDAFYVSVKKHIHNTCPLALGRHKVVGSLRQVITLNMHKKKAHQQCKNGKPQFSKVPIHILKKHISWCQQSGDNY